MKNWLIYGILGFAAYKYFTKQKETAAKPATVAANTAKSSSQAQAQATNNQSAVYDVTA